MSDEDLITALNKAAVSEKERNQASGKKRQLKVYELGSHKSSNSAGKCDNKVDKLVSVVELLTKEVSTLQSEISNVKGDGYKKNVSDDFNSGDRRGRNVILCKNCKDNNRTICNHCFQCGSSNHLARGCRNPSSGETERDCWYWATSNQRGFAQKLLSLLFEKYYSCSSCKYVYFCGRECQLRSWAHDKTICTSIATLHGQHKEKTYKSDSLTPKGKKKAAELIGDKCLIQCRLNQREESVLLDTGAQVSVISEDYVQQNHAEIKHISHILDQPDSMSVQ